MCFAGKAWRRFKRLSMHRITNADLLRFQQRYTQCYGINFHLRPGSINKMHALTKRAEIIGDYEHSGPNEAQQSALVPDREQFRGCVL